MVTLLVPLLVSLSLPARGAWIEILTSALATLSTDSRSPHGERGLKCV